MSRMSRKRAHAVDIGDWGDEPIRALPSTLMLERRITTTRPHPPEHLGEQDLERFEPDAEFAEWIRGTFVDATGPLANERHAHLTDARLGVLWTNAINVRQMRHVVATAEMPTTMGSRWKQGRFEQQLRDWFGASIDFLLTFYAPEMAMYDNRGFCATVEHELCHCGQAEDVFGSPRFTREGAPVFAIRGHDVEEHIDVVERYGVVSHDIRRLVNAAKRVPLLGDGPINIACGTCSARAA